jgi:hypothetical protein
MEGATFLHLRFRGRRMATAAVGALVAGAMLVGTGMGSTAHAYYTPPYAIAVNAPCTTVPQGTTCTVTATITDANGNPVKDVTVNWTSSGCGSVDPITGVTGSDGTTPTTFTAGNNCCTTPATITATAPDLGISGSTTILVDCPGAVAGLTSTPAPGTGIGLPGTGGSPSGGGGLPAWALGTLLSGLLLLVGGSVFLGVTRRRVEAS